MGYIIVLQKVKKGKKTRSRIVFESFILFDIKRDLMYHKSQRDGFIKKGY